MAQQSRLTTAISVTIAVAMTLVGALTLFDLIEVPAVRLGAWSVGDVLYLIARAPLYPGMFVLFMLHGKSDATAASNAFVATVGFGVNFLIYFGLARLIYALIRRVRATRSPAHGDTPTAH